MLCSMPLEWSHKRFSIVFSASDYELLITSWIYDIRADGNHKHIFTQDIMNSPPPPTPKKREKNDKTSNVHEGKRQILEYQFNS